jgi:RNA polymerase-binding protein DksA
VAKTSSKKPASKSAGKSTTKSKTSAPKVTAKPVVAKVSAKSPSPKSKPVAKPVAKPAAKSVAPARPLPRVTAPPKAKSALSKTDKHDRRVVDQVRSSNGKPAAVVPVPRVTPAPAAPTGTKPTKSAKSANRAPREGILIPRPTPGKNAAGLSAKELDQFRELLLAKRRELVGDMYSMEREALQRSGENLSNLPIHMADMGTDNYEQEFTLGLMEKDRQLLREINTALMKIQNGMYGICEGTGKPISKARLEVQPWAKYSIEHARKLEDRKFVRF